MKKRWAMGLLCCLLLFQLAFPAKAAVSVYFVAAEESVLPVTDATMPFWANGYLYVPASVFTNLGISVINNTAKKMTVLEKDRRAMLFDWTKGTAAVYSPPASFSPADWCLSRRLPSQTFSACNIP